MSALREAVKGAFAVGPTDGVDLSPRQAQILRCIANGLAQKQIAADLGIAVGSVARHCNRLYRKLGAHDRAEAVARGMRIGLIALDEAGDTKGARAVRNS